MPHLMLMTLSLLNRQQISIYKLVMIKCSYRQCNSIPASDDGEWAFTNVYAQGFCAIRLKDSLYLSGESTSSDEIISQLKCSISDVEKDAVQVTLLTSTKPVEGGSAETCDLKSEYEKFSVSTEYSQDVLSHVPPADSNSGQTESCTSNVGSGAVKDSALSETSLIGVTELEATTARAEESYQSTVPEDKEAQDLIEHTLEPPKFEKQTPELPKLQEQTLETPKAEQIPELSKSEHTLELLKSEGLTSEALKLEEHSSEMSKSETLEAQIPELSKVEEPNLEPPKPEERTPTPVISETSVCSSPEPHVVPPPQPAPSLPPTPGVAEAGPRMVQPRMGAPGAMGRGGPRMGGPRMGMVRPEGPRMGGPRPARPQKPPEPAPFSGFMSMFSTPTAPTNTSSIGGLFSSSPGSLFGSSPTPKKPEQQKSSFFGLSTSIAPESLTNDIFGMFKGSESTKSNDPAQSDSEVGKDHSAEDTATKNLAGGLDVHTEKEPSTTTEIPEQGVKAENNEAEQTGHTPAPQPPADDSLKTETSSGIFSGFKALSSNIFHATIICISSRRTEDADKVSPASGETEGADRSDTEGADGSETEGPTEESRTGSCDSLSQSPLSDVPSLPPSQSQGNTVLPEDHTTQPEVPITEVPPETATNAQESVADPTHPDPSLHESLVTPQLNSGLEEGSAEVQEPLTTPSQAATHDEERKEHGLKQELEIQAQEKLKQKMRKRVGQWVRRRRRSCTQNQSRDSFEVGPPPCSPATVRWLKVYNRIRMQLLEVLSDPVLSALLWG
ncbi:hypothetical protein WMY93_012936 [Mugilogobius chulae]|uniref:Uncharacterized protein n=1 Tax=Mugilogobius chulae TaxID=88201 RepID=A0AAW0NY33_9GOBI